MAFPTPTASVLIPTRNRRQLLVDTIGSVLRQTVPVEVIVVDDGSSDGTSDHVSERFPSDRYPVRVIRHAASAGPTRRRNEAAAAAVTPFLFTIDDDCLVPSPRTFEQALAGFDGDPRVAGVTIPFVNVRQGPEVHYRATEGAGPEVTHIFFGGMVAFRRSAFLGVGGYRPSYFMHVEEPDLSVRLLAAGHVVRLGSADPIHHLESPARNRPKLFVLGVRNQVLYHWYNTPMPELLVRLPVAAAGSFLHTALRLRRPDLAAWGLIRGLGAATLELRRRRPVPRSVHRLARLLRQGPLPLAQVEAQLPPMASWTGQ